jgi:hypothetical protein
MKSSLDFWQSSIATLENGYRKEWETARSASKLNPRLTRTSTRTTTIRRDKSALISFTHR